MAALSEPCNGSGPSSPGSPVAGHVAKKQHMSSHITAFSSTFATRPRARSYITNNRRPCPALHLNVNQDYLSSLTNTNTDEEECIADDCLLTPQIYANSDDADLKVEDNISSKASTAFESTDFEHEPHLSPELEDTETAYEVAAMADAAHALADAAERESKQSKDAMLEREKEIEWIQNHQEEGAPFFLSPKTSAAEMNQRALFEAKLDMDRKAKIAAAKKREGTQRALLAARFAMEKKSKDVQTAEATEIRSEWMESEALAATMGAVEHTVGLASAAASQAGLSMEEAASYEADEPVSKLASTAERMILGEDIALDIALIEDAEEQAGEQQPIQPVEQKKTIAEVNQWRQDYVQEIRNYMQKKAVEQTKRRLSRKKKALEDSDNIETESPSDAAPERTGTTIASLRTENSAIKKALENGLIRRMRQRKRLLITALVMVLTRRLVLAWFGNAMRLI